MLTSFFYIFLLLKGLDHAFSVQELTSRAECIYALKCVKSNFSLNSNDENNDMFKLMFPDSEVAKLYAMHSSKCTYVLTHGIAPYLKKTISRDASKAPFTYLFDETTNAQVKKQYDGYITYFSDSFGKVITRYLGSIFSGHCTANDLIHDFDEVLKKESIDRNYLLQLGMDGPSVNTCFKRKLEENLKNQCNGKTILDIGTCNLHKVNNSFLYTIDQLSFQYDGFACDICFFFKVSSGRREDFAQMELETEIDTENMLPALQNKVAFHRKKCATDCKPVVKYK